MEFPIQRKKMVVEQLQKRGISDPAVLTAMGRVPRELFVPVALQESAYADSALPLEHDQTISQPYTVAFMCQALNLKPSDVVLEVGTGSGYGAAVLSRIVRQVYSIERIPELAAVAQERLAECGYPNVEVVVGDGTLGLPENGPYDAICVTAGAEQLPEAYPRQLADGGRILIPLSDGQGGQVMTRFTRTGQRLSVERLGQFRFVPLVSGEDESHSN